MKNVTAIGKLARMVLLASLLSVSTAPAAAQSTPGTTENANPAVGIKSINPTTVEILSAEGQRTVLDFYGESIFRLFRDPAGGIVRPPQARPEAEILVRNPRRPVSGLKVAENDESLSVATARIEVKIDRRSSRLSVVDLGRKATVIEELEAPMFEKGRVTVTLRESPEEYFYGGGVQNGRFSHKGREIAIENQNSWTDGGVASPSPFYWSTGGYGVLWHTFKKGRYDFGAARKGQVRLSHESDYLDIFYMVDDGAVALLNDLYQLTGNPVLLPKFGFYQGHLNAYNRDYWTENDNGILFEDGKRYKESQKDNGGIKESLNGEKDNYQFSARAVIDRYKRHDMPLGWVLPNDGYGAGYGQTSTLDGNIANLKAFGDYARRNGVEIGLWTQSDLHPKEGVSALLQRDIVKEVRDAGVRVLKTDVAWVGAGYSFGLNGVADVGAIMPYYGDNARPFIISLDGWAGTQRYAGIWSGDQTGGQWEYIRFHIPTYIGSGLSGQPNIGSDMDGIFGGRNAVVNTRDFQWKTFTPLELNMDGWGSNEKYPHALGEPVASINRMYLKLKSEIMPYTYSISREAVEGKPMVRAMFLDYPSPYTYGRATQYQYLYGPSLLVAPIYRATRADDSGNDIRDGIYLPEGLWIDYFTGDAYEGGRIINSFDAPLWKLPLFVKSGAIIPMVNPNNNVGEIDRSQRIYEIYPTSGSSSFTEYDDDGVSEAYKLGRGTTTLIESSADGRGAVTVTIHPTEGDFDGFVREKTTVLKINATEHPRKVWARIDGRKVKLTEVSTPEEFGKGENVFLYDAAPELNRFSTPGSPFASVRIVKNPQILVRLAPGDITSTEQSVTVEGYAFAPQDRLRVSHGTLTAPEADVAAENRAAYTLRPSWNPVAGADYYEIDFGGMTYSTIRDTTLLFGDLTPETSYTFRARAVNADGASEWAAFEASTESDPLEFAIRGIRGFCTAASQGRGGVRKLFDFVESAGEMWHSKYGEKAVPFDIVMDLVTVNTLDKLQYLPRIDAGNGTMLQGKIYYGMDRDEWTEAGEFDWKRSNEAKVFEFASKPTARYVKISVTKAVGDFGSGREIYVFKVPGTESWLQGDINADGKIDANDLTSYTNYTGLRRGDSDFEGYISNGDINRNGLIDAYDISVVATQLEGRVDPRQAPAVGGSITLDLPHQRSIAEGETVEIGVVGNGLQGVNALSFAIAYDQQAFEFVGVEPRDMAEMENLTYDRLHTDGSKVLYPTFVNVGNRKTLDGTSELFVLKFKARRKAVLDMKASDGLLVGKRLDTIKF